MKNFLDTEIQYYPADITKTVPLGKISLKEMIRAIKEPSNQMKELFKLIKEASALGDIKRKATLKKKLYYFTPCVTSDGKGRAYSNIVSFNELVQIDFDGITNAKEFRDYFFETYKSVVFAGVSPSGLGVKALIRIPKVSSTDEFKEYFCGLAYYLEEYRGFDVAPFNCCLPLYLFSDPDLKFRENPTVASVKGNKVNEFKKFTGEIEVLENVAEWKKERVKGYFIRGIERVVDNAHPQVISFSSMLGGYCSAGYLSEDEAEVLIENCIESNEYMSKDTKGYIRTAKNMLIRGMSSPLYLQEDE